ncbi:MAG: nucleoside deaminase [Verrucomicrobia bacterium]|jgi:tRNA(Arg) A34 adenosine deaminase TadA|nr:nucleoside deaminase [Verrucomicrobiota bacterium]
MFPEIHLRLPDWVGSFCEEWSAPFVEIDDRAQFVIELARANVARGTGGPFAAAIFDYERKTLVAPGVNLVLSASCSAAHAEVVAIMIAQQIMGTHDLGAEGIPMLELVSSTEPCAMCMGALPWSGVPRLVCSARGEDAIAIGFDEGAKPQQWQHELEQRGIAVARDVCREEATAVLRDYAQGGGLIYNGRSRNS